MKFWAVVHPERVRVAIAKLRPKIPKAEQPASECPPDASRSRTDHGPQCCGPDRVGGRDGCEGGRTAQAFRWAKPIAYHGGLGGEKCCCLMSGGRLGPRRVAGVGQPSGLTALPPLSVLAAFRAECPCPIFGEQLGPRWLRVPRSSRPSSRPWRAEATRSYSSRNSRQRRAR